MVKSDRRVQRTRDQLQNALIELFGEQEYNSITVQEIVDRANIGRTTFYLHYSSKDDLFISCHESIVRQFHFGLLHSFSQEELLASEVPPGLTAAFHHLKDAWVQLSPVFQGKDGPLLLQRIRNWSAQEIEANLHTAFADAGSLIPLDVLANYLAGAQIGLVQWWLEKQRSHTAEELAQAFHRLQRAVIYDAFVLKDAE